MILESSQVRRIEIRLEVGKTTSAVTVNASAAVFEKQEGKLSSRRVGQGILSTMAFVWLTRLLWQSWGAWLLIPGKMISWEQALNSQEQLVPDHIDWDTKVKIPPLAIPGKTKLF